MKTNLSLLVFIFISFLGYTQNFHDDLELIQSIYGLDKKDVVSEFVEINESQTNDFWILYNEYEIKRKEIGKQKFDLVWTFINDYGEINPQDAENFMKKIIPLRKKSDQLIDSYYKKIKNKTDPVVAVQFYQIENYLADLVRLKILEEFYITKH